MFKRVTIVALVVAAFLLMVAVPAMAFNGYRGDYTTTPACKECHNGRAGIPSVYPQWSESKHGTGEAYLDVYNRLPYGSVCQGCHTSNFAPSKLTPVPTATSTSGAVSWAASPAPSATGTAFPMDTQASGDLAWSESYIGCSSCHYGSNALGDLAVYGVDVNDTAHNAPYGQLANADICGACHSRYSYTKDTYAVQPVPYLTVTLPLPGTPVTPNPSATSLIQPQMAIGYPMLGSPAPSPSTGWDPAAPLSAYLITPVSNTGWSTNTMTPTPTATTGGFGKLQTYWQVNGGDSLWQQTGHDGSAAQYPEWASEGHASALNALTSQASIAGYKAVLMSACMAGRYFPMLTTPAGTLRPAKVLVLGVGVAGLQAIATARRLGAVVEAYDVRSVTREQVQSLGGRFIDTGIDAEALHRRAHDNRSLRHRCEHGVSTIEVSNTTAAGAEVMAALAVFQERIFRTTRSDGQRERFDAYAADALVAMARAALLGDGDASRTRSGSQVKVIVRVDYTALLRGHVCPGELCEISGVGPVPISVVDDLLAEDAFLAAVVTRGHDVLSVAHLGRQFTAFQHTALEF